MQRKFFMAMILMASVIVWAWSPFMAKQQALALAIPDDDQILLVGSFESDQVLIYDGVTAAHLGELVTPANITLDGPTGIAVGPDGDYYVASYYTDEILRYESDTWQFKDVFVPANRGGLFTPQGITFGPDNHLYVSSGTPHQILRFNGQTGEFIDAFTDGGGLSLPQGLTFGPDGHLYVVDGANEGVLRFDGTTGVYSDTFTAGEALNQPSDVKFAPDGHLHVSSSGNNAVFRFDGTTGFFINASASGSELDAPKGLAFGPDEELYVANSGQLKNNVATFNRISGEFKGEFVERGANGLSSPAYLLLTQMMRVSPTATPSPTTAATLTPSVTPSPTATITPGLSCDEVATNEPAITWQVNTTEDNLVDAITLRCALTYARAGDMIRFDPAVFPPNAPATILLTEALPDITQGNLIVDGSGAGVILDGRNLPASTAGLRLISNGNTIRGLQIVSMTGRGIVVEGNNNTIGGGAAERAVSSSVGRPPNEAQNVISGNGGSGISIKGNNNVVQANYIGTSANGLQVNGNGGSGIFVTQGRQNQIGGANGLGNLISGNGQTGIEIQGENSLENKVEGNFIGTDLNGSNALPNQAIGIEIHSDAHQNMIGNTAEGTGNLISGNAQQGIYLGGVFSTTVQSNIVGADINGNNAIPNAQNGIWLFDSRHTLIGEAGESCSTPCNLISGNTGSGIFINGAASQENKIVGNFIGTDKAGQDALPNSSSGVYLANGASNNMVGDADLDMINLISGNSIAGVLITGAESRENQVFGNVIGLDISRTAILGNRYGIELRDGANQNVIGGISPNQPNIISGNSSHGVYILGSETANNSVVQNYIGAVGDGVEYVGSNGGAGVMLEAGAHDNVIGFAGNEYLGNTIVQNATVGIGLDLAHKNQILGNLIGQSRDGTARGNFSHGVHVANKSSENQLLGNMITYNRDDGIFIESGSNNNQIGIFNLGLGDFNIIAANLGSGIHLHGSGTDNNRIFYNRIGSDYQARNGLGNASHGVHLHDGPEKNAFQDNHIVNSNLDGVLVNRANDNRFTRNLIGVTLDENNQEVIFGNLGYGIYVLNGSSDNAMTSNKVTNSGRDGILIHSEVVGQTVRNTMRTNSIYNNDDRGIYLNGGNQNLAAPEITDVENPLPDQWRITGRTCSACEVQMFWDSENEGKEYFAFVMADQNGLFSKSLALQQGLNLTLTATDGEGNTSEFSQPVAAGAASLVATHIEVTQAIQKLGAEFEEVPLIAGKRTAVRFHVRSNSGNQPNVTAYLNAFRDGERLEPRNLRAIRNPITVVGNPNRANAAESFNFHIPTAWASGTVEFVVEVNPERDIAELDYEDNRLLQTVTFHRRDRLCVEMVRVKTEEQTASMNDPHFGDVIQRAQELLPIPSFKLFRGGVVGKGRDRDPFVLPGDGSLLLKRLWWYNVWSDDPDSCNDQVYYFGMVHPSHNEGGHGRGYRPGDESWGIMHFTDFGTPWYAPQGGVTMAHELGHNLNRKHVDCENPENVDQNYPYDPGDACYLGPDDPLGYYGYSLQARTAIHPRLAGDIMSYKTPSWVSDYTYRALFNRLPRRTAASGLPEALAQAEEMIIITGIMTPSTGIVELDPFYKASTSLFNEKKVARAAHRQSLIEEGKESYTMRLVDANGATLSEQLFQLPDIHQFGGGEPLDSPFFIVMPSHSDLAKVVLLQGETELASRTASTNGPTVKLLSPNGGETVGDILTIEWEASDADGDELFYTVQYSADKGQTWQSIETNYSSKTLSVESEALAGSHDAIIRVIATDGINTSTDESDAPFTMQSHAPTVSIESAETTYEEGQLVILRGNALDTEDETISEQQFSWTSDKDGALSTGNELFISTLSTGQHLITLEVTDSDGKKGSASVSLIIGADDTLKFYLPIMMSNK